jgi:ABC-type dipeptide/oligopeptide/nickel transport system permease component
MPIMGIALLYGVVFSLINIAVDVTYGALDPRVSRS